MAKGVTYKVNDHPAPRSIGNVREAVGWERCEEDCLAALQRYDTTVSAYNESGILVGWCAAIIDGIYNGFFVEVIVHPQWQRQGVGSALVAAAINDLRAKGITLIHADFAEEHVAFYAHCGFTIGAGGFLKL